ncbi:hypothetical protein [Borreliella afzelii]|uniref:Uncharacterized protein n=2 Tax=Borreliella afzelii TaxID=29518 RepID=Q0SPE5_BORAP|nr:hypothetical protein [Borreliella afzelii]ABH01283.1 hypothetical protein BAPKO_0018 [Borreliella afzelii PKo]AJY72021.1 hypothetical protein BAFK78_019 [Borreliella afzelii K78]EEC20686.1 conserved hypothetical protein [Borreliella afzelii ACA-1]AEL69253.1 conserved hypothetical protein [Borreliella afzelii PKo]AIK18337.1 hypothetical protein P612_00095 [Borreliella afzelii Tom3107]
MLIKSLLLLFSVLNVYSNSFDHFKLNFNYLKLSIAQSLPLQEKLTSSGNFISHEKNNISVVDKDDSFLYKNIQENKALNLENDIESKSVKDLYRFSAISIGSFPIALFLSLFFFDVGYYFYSGMNANYVPYPFSNGPSFSKDEIYKKFIISASIGAMIALTIALIDYLLQ